MGTPQENDEIFHNILFITQVVAGGGAVETALSVYLESLAMTLGSREQLAVAEFADALLIIPKADFHLLSFWKNIVFVMHELVCKHVPDISARFLPLMQQRMQQNWLLSYKLTIMLHRPRLRSSIFQGTLWALNC